MTDQHSPTAPAVATQTANPKFKVLIVEDMRHYANDIAKILRNAGHEVFIATLPEEFDGFGGLDFDVALLDSHLEGWDCTGRDVAQKLGLPRERVISISSVSLDFSYYANSWGHKNRIGSTRHNNEGSIKLLLDIVAKAGSHPR